MKWLEKYWGIVRRMKVNYVIYNFFQQKQLKQNKALYKKYGIKKPVFATISSADFKDLPDDSPWLDKSDGQSQMNNSKEFLQFDSELQKQLSTWPTEGFVHLKGLLTTSKAQEVDQEVDRLIKDGTIDYNYTGKKIMFAYRKSEKLNEVANHPKIHSIMKFLLGKEMKAFQSINFIKSSEQHSHSDSVHMTTYPLGNMCAAWVALEDVGPDQGPLIYYPGSHKFPYLLNDKFDHGGSRFLLGKNAYLNYEHEMERLLKEKGIEPVELHAKAGDVFIWHANLIHGARKMVNKDLTRKSMVMHYFSEDAICYHEITQRPALIHKQ